ncbi:hypothetical protein IFM89_016611 [Coptis chinensis]|uniref:U1 small nuclear ribonucleoprotein C n=1 Tax=Coptis chinensis TaxID=261450 RepID=A0A835IR17_9MAGN|nr:hypothetical protein IFM89_016611 [Coptis chinensis]
MPRYYCDYCDTYLTHDSPSVRKQHNAGYKHKANVRTYYQQFEEQQTQSLIDQRIKEHLGQTAAFQQVGAAYNQHLASFPPRPRLPILPSPMPIPGTAQGLMNSGIPGMRPPVLPRPAPPVLCVEGHFKCENEDLLCCGILTMRRMKAFPTKTLLFTAIAGYCHCDNGYGPGPMMPPMVAPPGAPSMPMQVNGLPRPPTMNPPLIMPGGTSTAVTNGLPSLVTQAVYQGNPTASGSGAFDSYNNNATPGLQGSATGGTTASSTNSTSQDGYSYSQASDSNH